jgi:urea transporter
MNTPMPLERDWKTIGFEIWSSIRSVLGSYAQVWFSTRSVPGLFFLVATFVVPFHGASGLLGLLSANAFARLLSRPREHVEEGYYGFNGLLLGLALGLFFRFSFEFVGLLLVAEFFMVLVAAGLRHLAERFFGVPVLSLAFVLATWIALLAARRLYGLEFTVAPIDAMIHGAGFLPLWVEIFFCSLGAAFFQLSPASGILVFLGLLVSSRWATLLAVIGFAAGFGVHTALGGSASDIVRYYVGFNFALAAVAVGGVWLVVSPASLVLAAAAGAVSAIASAATFVLLEPLNLPPLALPFIATTQLFLLAAYTGRAVHRMGVVRGVPGSPEENVVRAAYQKMRYPDPQLPVVYLPVMGRWTVTQGHDGEHTHQGLWRHGLDLEVFDDEGKPYRSDGATCEDYYCFGAPVVAPADGKVVRVVGHLADNRIGDVDTANNWGNLVILWHSGLVYSALCHLKKDSLLVVEGQHVVAGQVLARAGSSGRSPRPHLHFQLQASADIGAPTISGELLHYLSGAHNDQRYVTHGVPLQGECVAPLMPDDDVRRALFFPPGRTVEFDVTVGGKRHSERWEHTIDEVGGRHIVERARGEAVSLYSNERYFTLLEYQGLARSALGWLYLAMPRIPLLADECVRIEDRPSSRGFVPLFQRLVHELVLPFLDLGGVQSASVIRREGDRVRITTTLETSWLARGAKAVPDRLETILVIDQGLVSLRAYRGGERMGTVEARN